MIERLLRWLGLRPPAPETLGASGRLDLTIDGERWAPVTSFAGRGPDERVYVLHVDDDGATVTFGDGTTGRRPPVGASIVSSYRQGLGAIGDTPSVPPDRDPLKALVDLLAEMADRLAAAQDQIASEAYIATASGSVVPLTDRSAVRRECAERGSTGIDVRIRFQPWTDPDPDPP